MSLSPRRWWLEFQVWRLGTSWLGGRKWYQYIDFGDGLTTAPWSKGESQLRTSSFLSFLQSKDLLSSDDVVVDIGCNAGLFSLVAAQRCRQVYGVEIDRRFLRHAKFVKGWWKGQGKRVDNVTFLEGSITAHLDLVSQATVVYASKVLYHALLEEGLERLMDAIEKGRARLIIMQGHTPRGEHGQDEGMRNLATRYGFDYRLVADIREYPIAIATRQVRAS